MRKQQRRHRRHWSAREFARRRPRIPQTQIDFLCLAVFGMRALPDDMAARIGEARDRARGIELLFARLPDRGESADGEPGGVGSAGAEGLEAGVAADA